MTGTPPSDFPVLRSPHEKCWPWCKCGVKDEIEALTRDKEILLSILTPEQMEGYRVARMSAIADEGWAP